MPDSPASSALQLSGAVPPSGLVAPMPVTTIFLRSMVPCPLLLLRGPACEAEPRRTGLALCVDDEVDRVAHGLQVLHLVVGDLDVELLLGVHHDGHHRDGVDV